MEEPSELLTLCNIKDENFDREISIIIRKIPSAKKRCIDNYEYVRYMQKILSTSIRYPSLFDDQGVMVEVCNDDIYELFLKMNRATIVAEIKEIVNICNADEYYRRSNTKLLYNRYFGWALPTEKALNIILNAWTNHLQKYPNARFIDYGAGTGIYCLLLEALGIPRDKLIALDRIDDDRAFYPLTVSKNFDFQPDDCIFIAWGHGQDLRSCIQAGCHCFIFQGEKSGGCTFPVDYFDIEVYTDEYPGEGRYFTETFDAIPSLALWDGEYITVNIRK
jgi:hypothetical protein